MGWFAPATGLSKKAEKVLTGMAYSGSSEGSGVAEILNTIAQNGGEQARNDFLVDCATEIRDWADGFIKQMSPKPKKPAKGGRGKSKTA